MLIVLCVVLCSILCLTSVPCVEDDEYDEGDDSVEQELVPVHVPLHVLFVLAQRCDPEHRDSLVVHIDRPLEELWQIYRDARHDDEDDVDCEGGALGRGGDEKHFQFSNLQLLSDVYLPR